MHAQFNATIEDTIFASDIDGMDIDVHLGRDNLRDLVEQSNPVNTAQTDGGVEEEFLVHVPLDVEDTVAETGLQLGGYRTVSLVDLNLVLVVDVTKGIITWDGVTTPWEFILTDVFFRNVDGLLTVELLWYDE